MATKTQQLAAIIAKAISYMTQGGMTTGAALEKARKESPGADNITKDEVDAAWRQHNIGDNVGSPVGHIDVP
ncbi:MULTISPECIES: hypothetical protein [Streptomyces]|nr:hypothetical protein [Streptomyces albospinus]